MNAQTALEVIHAQFPELAPARVSYLGEGCDSTAFEVNDRWVFRFPKTKAVERQMEIESRLLPLLAPRLPVPVPVFQFYGEASSLFGRRFCGYAKLPGEPAIRLKPESLSVGALATSLGRFFSALHAFPVDDAARAGVPEQQLDESLREIRTDALDDLERVSEIAPEAPIAAWRRFLEAGVEPARTHRTALVHNDFSAEHALFDSSAHAITGVIDWSDVAISDPAVDFAGLYHWGGHRLVREVLAKYEGGLGESELRLARYMAACRGAMDVSFGLDHGRPEYVAAGLRALNLCAG